MGEGASRASFAPTEAISAQGDHRFVISLSPPRHTLALISIKERTMHLTRSSALVALLSVCGLAQAEVRVEGPVEYGIFEGPQAELQSGERVLRRSNEQIRQTESVPAKLGTKFGMRYQLAGKEIGRAHV